MQSILWKIQIHLKKTNPEQLGHELQPKAWYTQAKRKCFLVYYYNIDTLTPFHA